MFITIDDNTNTCILFPNQYNLIWRFSFLSLISTSFIILNPLYYDLAAVPFGVFITSVNYWFKPDYSYRRYIDMIYIYFALTYQIIRTYDIPNIHFYYISLGYSIIYYYFGIYFYNKQMYWMSTYCHCLLHVFANISNIILYQQLNRLYPIKF